METMPDNDPMENPLQPPLAGLDPADLLKQGAADDTFVDGEASSFTPPSIEELTAIFPQFEILELIGKGGMGAVYKVRQKDLDRVVALKILPPASGQSPEFSNRFTREAKALAKLNHPGIVTIHEFGQADGLYFILMEFVDGVNLAQLMRTGRISPREALAIVPQICDALQFAHDQGIVHRDIKPENLLLDRLGRVKVADFGIAKVVASVCEDPLRSGDTPAPTDQTLAGKIIGTAHYMAPEQIDHPADVDHRADIYALGVVFYQMLTGELPGKRLEAPSKKVHIDVRLDEIVIKAMEKNPGQRYQQASVMKTRVEGLEEARPNKNEASPSAVMSLGRTRRRGHGSFGSWIFFIAMMILVPASIFLTPVKDPLLLAVLTAFLILHYRLKQFFKTVTVIVIAVLILGSIVVWDRLRSPASLHEVQKSAATVDHKSEKRTNSSFSEAGSQPLLMNEEALKELPKLRRLAWQDVYHREIQGSWIPGTAWLPSGDEENSGDGMPPASGFNPPKSPVVAGDPAYLSMWFSHPLFDSRSAVKIALLDDAGNPFAEPHSGNIAIGHTPSTPGSSKPGWITTTIGAGITGQMPAAAKVILRYGVGPWQAKGKEIPANFRGAIALGHGIMTTDPGQDHEGKSFIQITRDSSADPGNDQLDFVAIMKDGRRIESEGRGRYGSGLVSTERFSFDVPLSDVEMFICRTRPIQALTWDIPLRNVAVKSPNDVEQAPGEFAAEPRSQAEKFMDLETQAIQARAAYLESDPLRRQAEEDLANFIAAHPEFPNDTSRKVAAQRRAGLAVKIDELAKRYGPGHGEILQLNRELDLLNQLTEIGEKQLRLETAEVVLAGDLPKENRLQVRRVAPDDPNAEVMEMEVTEGGQKEELRVSREVIVRDQHIERTSIISEADQHRLDITLNKVGGARMSEATAGEPGEIRLAIIVDGRITSAPVVRDQLGNRFQITGLRSREEALELLRSFPSWEREIQAADAFLWLMLIDGEKFAESYDSASEYFRNSLTKEQWTALLKQFREPLGRGIPPRKIKQVDEAKSLPGAPDGDYRVMQFHTQFPNKNDAVETVTLMLEKDGSWKAAGYIIR